ncbi:hypothetical protein [Chryseobacterium sp. MP_3.2]|uniref:hypothetical protein n=1 Tax=Chryseobacterium sp. MP_3.2 TaxID=3071712 RepID=UPI002E0ACD7B|nr:hypothetical protein [Chryseobacterium sp. MP_3.2]
MIPENNSEEQKRKLEEMDYNPGEDIFNKEEHISLDGDGNPILNNNQPDAMPFGLDIPGVEDDDNFEQFTNQIPTENESVHKSDERGITSE